MTQLSGAGAGGSWGGPTSFLSGRQPTCLGARKWGKAGEHAPDAWKSSPTEGRVGCGLLWLRWRTVTAVIRGEGAARPRPAPPTHNSHSPLRKPFTPETGSAFSALPTSVTCFCRWLCAEYPLLQGFQTGRSRGPATQPLVRGRRRQKRSVERKSKGGRTTFPRRLRAHSASGRSAYETVSLVVGQPRRQVRRYLGWGPWTEARRQRDTGGKDNGKFSYKATLKYNFCLACFHGRPGLALASHSPLGNAGDVALSTMGNVVID